MGHFDICQSHLYYIASLRVGRREQAKSLDNSAEQMQLLGDSVYKGTMLTTPLASRLAGSSGWHYSLMFVVGLGIVLFNLIFPDHIPLQNGFGYDEYTRFRPIVLSFPDSLLDHSIDTSVVQRFLIYGLMHVVLTTCKVPLTDGNIVTSFRLYQSIVLLACVLAWICIVRQMRLSKTSAWLGFIALFVNYQTMKFIFYRPVLTDCTAILVALSSLYFYISRRLLPLFLVSVVSLLVWPTSVLYQSVLLLLPPEQQVPSSVNSKPEKLFGIGAALVCLALCSYFYSHGFTDRQICPPIWPLVPVGIALLSLYAYFVSAGIFQGIDLSPSAVRSVLSNIGLARILCVGLIIGIFIFLTHFVAHHVFHRGLYQEMERISLSGTSRPLVFLVAHFEYLGPFVLLIIRDFKDYCANLRGLGLGLTIVVALALAQAMHAETRHLCNLLPYLVLPYALMFNTKKISVINMFIISLVISRFWFPINSFCPPGDASNFPSASANTRYTFPAQAYFMSDGQHMCHMAYFAFLILFGLTWLYFSRERFKMQKSLSPSVAETNRSASSESSRQQVLAKMDHHH